jgi:prepilin signal peptidase PulO-like enzyme (type II secretory pathway)
MNAAAAAFVLAPALALGSFLNVVVARVPARRSILRPPSSCGTCSTEILWRDNIPVLSYVLLRGRCRHCSARISPLYPVVELVTAALIVACFAVFGPTAWAALSAGFCAVLVALSVIDAQHRIVPNRIVVPAAVVALVAHTAIDPSLAWLAWALIAAGGLFLAVLAYPKGLGMGDVKLALLLGAVLGASVTAALMIGFFAALIPSFVLFAKHGASARKMGVPLVPFLALGAVTALFFGDVLLDAYLALFAG